MFASFVRNVPYCGNQACWLLLAQSTLIMMVSALAGRERILCSYAMAVRNDYKFFSYGDCMLIV